MPDPRRREALVPGASNPDDDPLDYDKLADAVIADRFVIRCGRPAEDDWGGLGWPNQPSRP